MDGLFGCIMEKDDVQQETTQVILEFMKLHQYDSEAVREDLVCAQRNQSNLYKIAAENTDFLSIAHRFIAGVDRMYSFLMLPKNFT